MMAFSRVIEDVAGVMYVDVYYHVDFVDDGVRYVKGGWAM